VLNLQAQVFEQNFIYIVLGFALFGLVIGYTIRKVAIRRMEAE
jgi:NhaP-type Na+/H+ or K+/H+ antiporter